MDATATRRVFGGRGPGWPRAGLLAALVLVGILVQGCTDNNGRVTGTESKVTGDAIGGPLGTLFVRVTVNPGTIDRGRRGSVLIIVTNANGIGLAGRNVQLTSSLGTLDDTQGVTGEGGLFSTTIFVPCEAAPASSGVVTAIAEGAVSTGGAFTAVTSVSSDPCS